MTQVALFQGDAAAQAIGKFRQLGMEKAQVGNGLFLKMDKTGHWVYGAEGIEVDTGSLWAINPMSIKVGYIGWNQGKVQGEHMYPFLSGNRVNPEDLAPINSPKKGDGWKEQKSLEMKSIDDGTTELIWKASSGGGMDAFADLGDALASQIATDPGKPVPVVRLMNSFYKHAEYGKIFKPVLDIVEWRSMDAEEPARKELV